MPLPGCAAAADYTHTPPGWQRLTRTRIELTALSIIMGLIEPIQGDAILAGREIAVRGPIEVCYFSSYAC